MTFFQDHISLIVNSEFILAQDETLFLADVILFCLHLNRAAARADVSVFVEVHIGLIDGREV